MASRIAMFLAAIALALALPRPAGARPKPAHARAPKAAPPAAPEPLGSALSGEARTEYEQARALFKDGDFSGALKRYERAHELQPDPRLLWNIAVCEKQLRRYAKVLPLVDRFLAEAAPVISAEDRRQAKEFTQAVRALIGELTLECLEEHTEVFIDEERISEACLAPRLLDGGEHRLRATKPGFKQLALTVTVPSGGAIKVSLPLEPEPREGHLSVTAEAEDFITVDGQGAGRARWTGALSSGRHTLLVSAPGKMDYRAEIELAEREDRSVQVVLEPEPSAIPTWAWIVGGTVLAAGAATGGYFLFRPAPPKPIEGTLGSHAL